MCSGSHRPPTVQRLSRAPKSAGVHGTSLRPRQQPGCLPLRAPGKGVAQRRPCPHKQLSWGRESTPRLPATSRAWFACTTLSLCSARILIMPLRTPRSRPSELYFETKASGTSPALSYKLKSKTSLNSPAWHLVWCGSRAAVVVLLLRPEPMLPVFTLGLTCSLNHGLCPVMLNAARCSGQHDNAPLVAHCWGRWPGLLG